jgi:hypothetical protein
MSNDRLTSLSDRVKELEKISNQECICIKIDDIRNRCASCKATFILETIRTILEKGNI